MHVLFYEDWNFIMVISNFNACETVYGNLDAMVRSKIEKYVHITVSKRLKLYSEYSVQKYNSIECDELPGRTKYL